jgi:hypothetical protein
MMLSHVFEADFLTLYNYINWTLRSRLTSNHDTFLLSLLCNKFSIYNLIISWEADLYFLKYEFLVDIRLHVNTIWLQIV